MSIKSIQQKAAQVIFPRLGSNMPPPVRVSEDFDRFWQMQEQHQFGGLVLFNGHNDDTPGMLTELQRMSQTPVLVSSDIERGAGQQIEGATLFPHAMACGSAGTEAVTALARITAEEALAAGIHIAFAPVADVNSNPMNPIIGIRALGTQPDIVSSHVRTYIQTCNTVGLLTTAKHFPGHGDTATDSHAELPVVDKSFQSLDETELPPFKTAIAAGVDLVMTAHVAYPKLDPQKHPATRSAPILIDLLRKKLKFKGPVISDSLIMKAIQPNPGDVPFDAQANQVTIAQYAASLLNAGIDILLDPINPEEMLQGVVKAVQDGLLLESRLDEALLRVQRLRNKLTDRFGPSFFTHQNKSRIAGSPGHKRNIEQARQVARRAINRTKGSVSFPVLDPEKRGKLVVFVTPYKTRLDPDQTPLQKAIVTQLEDVVFKEADASTSSEAIQQVINEARTATEALVVVVSKPAAWHAYGLPGHLSSLVTKITTITKTTLVSLGDPNILDAYPSAAASLCTYSDVPASQSALVDFLLDQSVV